MHTRSETIRAGSVVMILSALSFAANPIIPWDRNADPAPRVWDDGRVYLYCSHDQDDATYFWSMDNYRVYSSTDLVNWTDHGEVLNSSQISWTGPGGLWAPDCMYRNGTYYFYFPCLVGGGGTGVATSPNPAGPFVDALGQRMTGGEIDPYIFKDDDGQYYFIQGGLQGATTIARMNDDMVSLAESKRTINNGSGFNWEGNWMYKRNGIYYLHGASGGGNYGMGSSPYGPFTYKGKIINGFDHPGILNYKGQWYYFSQITNYTDANGISGADWRRNITIEYMHFNDDGTIQYINRTTEGVSIPDTTPPTAPSGLTATPSGPYAVSLGWSPADDPDTDISRYNIYRDGILTGSTQGDETTFTDSDLNEGAAYTYEVSAVNGATVEGPKSNSVNVSTVADNDPPGIALVSASTSVLVVFDEPVEEAGAANAANYAIDQGVTVETAALGIDRRSVTLTVSAMNRGVTYTLTVNNVRDRAASPNTIAPNTTVEFTVIIGISKIRFYPRVGFESRMVGGVFEGTNGDEVDGPYTELHRITSQPPSAQWTEVTALSGNDIGYRYVRYRAGGFCNVAEIEFYTGAVKAVGAAFGSPGSWQNSGDDCSKAFDNDISTHFDYSSETGGFAGLDLQGYATAGRIVGQEPARRPGQLCRIVGNRIYLLAGGNLTVANALGATVLHRRASDATAVDLDGLRPGMYAVKIDHTSGQQVESLVIQAR